MNIQLYPNFPGRKETDSFAVPYWQDLFEDIWHTAANCGKFPLLLYQDGELHLEDAVHYGKILSS